MAWTCRSDGKKFACLGLLLLVCLAVSPSPTIAQDESATFGDLVSKGDAARDEKDFPRAIQLYGQALQLNPAWKQGWWYLGLLEYETNAYPAARDALSRYLALEPEAAPAFALRGLCEFETGEYGPSLQDIERGLFLGAGGQLRNEQILRYHEALLLARAGRFQDALRAYAWFARKGITSPELIEQIGLAGLRMTAPENPDDKAKSLVNAAGQAAFEYMAGRDTDAQASFRTAFQQYPSAPNLHLLYGYLLFERNPVDAQLEFKRELDVNPSNGGANVMLAWAYLMQDNASAALPYAKKAEREDPELPVAQLVLGRSLVETGDIRDGTQYLEKASRLDPANPEIHIALAQAYSEAGRKEDARRERMESLRLTSAVVPVANP